MADSATFKFVWQIGTGSTDLDNAFRFDDAQPVTDVKFTATGAESGALTDPNDGVFTGMPEDGAKTDNGEWIKIGPPAPPATNSFVVTPTFPTGSPNADGTILFTTQADPDQAKTEQTITDKNIGGGSGVDIADYQGEAIVVGNIWIKNTNNISTARFYVDYGTFATVTTTGFTSGQVDGFNDTPFNPGSPVTVKDGWYIALYDGESLGSLFNTNDKLDSSSYLATDQDIMGLLETRSATDYNGNAMTPNNWDPTATSSGNNFFFGSQGLAGLKDIFYIEDQDAIACFLEGTNIATQDGQKAIEQIQVGDYLKTKQGISPVRFVSKTRHFIALTASDELPVLIRKGSFGGQVPSQDLCVSPNHHILIDGHLVKAHLLVNGSSIIQLNSDQLGDSQTFTYYNIELDSHCIIYAEDLEVESYFDIVPRTSWDNYPEYVMLYGKERVLEELDFPVISHARQLPAHLALKLQLQSSPAALVQA
ncbi:MAG: Hint domain-containing protein [Cyanobium sp. CZS 48M]|nr:Hint domain-containing protein [Cyanobium sp. CZS48M]